MMPMHTLILSGNHFWMHGMAELYVQPTANPPSTPNVSHVGMGPMSMVNDVRNTPAPKQTDPMITTIFGPTLSWSLPPISAPNEKHVIMTDDVNAKSDTSAGAMPGSASRTPALNTLHM